MDQFQWVAQSGGSPPDQSGGAPSGDIEESDLVGMEFTYPATGWVGSFSQEAGGLRWKSPSLDWPGLRIEGNTVVGDSISLPPYKWIIGYQNGRLSHIELGNNIWKVGRLNSGDWQMQLEIANLPGGFQPWHPPPKEPSHPGCGGTINWAIQTDSFEQLADPLTEDLWGQQGHYPLQEGWDTDVPPAPEPTRERWKGVYMPPRDLIEGLYQGNKYFHPRAPLLPGTGRYAETGRDPSAAPRLQGNSYGAVLQNVEN